MLTKKHKIWIRLELLDNKIGASKYLKGKGREAGSFLEEAWDNNVVEPFGRMYFQLEKSIENMYINRMRFGY